jgi:hypothetical protein
MHGCQTGTKCPIVHVKDDQACPIHFSNASPEPRTLLVMLRGDLIQDLPLLGLSTPPPQA